MKLRSFWSSTVSVNYNISSLPPHNLQKINHAVIAFSLVAHDYYRNASIAVCIVAFAYRKVSSITNVGCSLNHLFVKRIWLPEEYMQRNYGRALMVTYQWQAEDSTTGIFFVCDFRIDISVFVRLVCDFFQSLSHFLLLNRHSPPWVMVCFRSVILSLIALLTTNAVGCYTPHLIVHSR